MSSRSFSFAMSGGMGRGADAHAVSCHRPDDSERSTESHRTAGSSAPLHAGNSGRIHRAAGFPDAADEHFRRSGPGARGDRHLRTDGVLRRAAHPRNRHPDGLGGSIAGCAEHGRSPRHAPGAGGSRDGCGRSLLPDALHSPASCSESKRWTPWFSWSCRCSWGVWPLWPCGFPPGEPARSIQFGLCGTNSADLGSARPAQRLLRDANICKHSAWSLRLNGE